MDGHTPPLASLVCSLTLFFFLFLLTPSLILARPTLAIAQRSFQESCLPCPPATYSPADNKNCSNASLECGAGFCLNVTWCLVCPAGTASDAYNVSVCAPCPDGKVAMHPSTLKCQSCRAGQTSSTDHTQCVPCTAGYFNPAVAGTCGPCPPGSYSERQSVRCLACPAGTFNSWQAQGGCRECPSGHYCPSGSVYARQCPADQFCEAGAAQPTSCQPLFRADAGSSSCQPAPVFYVVIGLGAGALVMLCLVVWITVSYRRPLWKRIKKAYRHHQRAAYYAAPAPPASVAASGSADSAANKPLIPEPLPGPVYAGL